MQLTHKLRRRPNFIPSKRQEQTRKLRWRPRSTSLRKIQLLRWICANNVPNMRFFKIASLPAVILYLPREPQKPTANFSGKRELSKIGIISFWDQENAQPEASSTQSVEFIKAKLCPATSNLRIRMCQKPSTKMSWKWMAPSPWYLCRIASHIATKTLNATPSCTRLATRALRTSGCVEFLDRAGHQQTQNFRPKWLKKRDIRCIKFLPDVEKSPFWLENTVLLISMICSKDLSSFRTQNYLTHQVFAKLKMCPEVVRRSHLPQLPLSHQIISAMPVFQLKKYYKLRLKIRIFLRKMKISAFTSKI